MNKKILRVISLIVSVFLFFSMCGCKNNPTDEEIFYEYEYVDDSSKMDINTNQNGSNNMDNSGNQNGSNNIGGGNSSTQSTNTNASSGGQTVKPTTPNQNGNTGSTPSGPLPYTYEEYLHKSVTISFENSSAKTYGFTWNSIGKPIKPVLKISQGSTFNESNCKEYVVTYKQYESYFSQDFASPYYVSKALVTGLEPNTEYSYMICDDGAKVYTEAATFKTANPSASSFTFLHFADSQVTGKMDATDLGAETGISFNNTLSAATANCPSPAFMLHTGDIVEWSKYEGYWENMLDFNKKYFNKYIFAPISGNHETTYRNGKNEIFKHFNIKTEATDTTKGFYYYFDYGNARFIMLNTNDLTSDKKLKADQMAWLAQVLSNNPKKWTIVSMHNPLYSPGKYGESSDYNSICLALRKQLSSLFAQYNVDLVLQGHDHVYSRTHPIDQNGTPLNSSQTQSINNISYYVKPNGTIYSMHGASGNQTRGVVSNYTREHYSFTKTSKESSWAEISVDNDKLTVKVYYASNGGAVLADSYGITK